MSQVKTIVSAAKAIELLKSGTSTTEENLKLFDCIIAEDLVIDEYINISRIQNCDFESVTVKGNMGSLAFNGCTFKKNLHFDGVVSYLVSIQTCTLRELELKNSTLQFFGVEGKQTNIHSVDIRESKVQECDITGGKITNIAVLPNSEVSQIKISNTQSETMHFWGTCGRLTVSDCKNVSPGEMQFLGESTTLNILHCSNFKILMNNIKVGILSLANNTHTELLLDDGEITDAVIHGGHFTNFKIIKLNKLKLKVLQGEDGTKAKIDTLDLTGFMATEGMKLHFNQIESRKVILKDFDNYGFFQLNQAEIT